MYSQKLANEKKKRLESAVLGRPLVEHTPSEVDEWLYRLRDAFDVDGTPLRPLDEGEQAFIANELSLSQVDFRYWLTRYCQFASTEGKMIRLNPWPSQERIIKYLAEKEEQDILEKGRKHTKAHIILLKPRQIGGTTFGEALVAHLVFLNPLYRAVIASDHEDNKVKMFQVIDRIYNHLPPWMKPARDTRVKGAHLYFNELQSDVVIGAGNQKTTLGQGLTLDAVHLTEVSTWEMWQMIPSDIMLAFKSSEKHHSVMIMESTGAGARGNWFHDKYQQARRGESEFYPIFAPWYERPTYRRDATGLELSESTILLAEQVAKRNGVILDKEQMAYYQVERREFEAEGKLDLFLQEFCTFEEDAWQTGMMSVFKPEVRTRIRDKCRAPVHTFEVDYTAKKLREVIPTDDPTGRVVVWEKRRPGYTYVVGVDASYGLEGGDNAAIQVIRVGNRFDPDEQVAEFCGTVDPISLAIPAILMGTMYTDSDYGSPAKMAVEANPGSPGGITLPEVMRSGYSNLYIWRKTTTIDGGYTKQVGWYTTPSTRPILTSTGEKALKEGSLAVNSVWLADELKTYVAHPLELGRSKHAAAEGYHDDRIMALFIALVVAHEDDVLNLAEERRAEQARKAGERARREGLGGGPTSYQARAITWEQAQAEWEDKFLG